MSEPVRKTMPCWNMINRGRCLREGNCAWSHDPDDLRSGAAYKKIQCIQWAENGSCKFGRGCLYLHEGFVSDMAMRKDLGEQAQRLVFTHDSGADLYDVTPRECQERGSYSRTVNNESLIVVPGERFAAVNDDCPG
nr:hypothetical protein CFP56_54390 [Quercus suber]